MGPGSLTRARRAPTEDLRSPCGVAEVLNSSRGYLAAMPGPPSCGPRRRRGTVARAEGRQLLGTGWVSHLLQQLVAALLADDGTATALLRADETDRQRREALLEALAERGIAAYGRSGLNVWVPVAEETRTVRFLHDKGWAVAAGERWAHR
jgi:hypothetical protein